MDVSKTNEIPTLAFFSLEQQNWGQHCDGLHLQSHMDYLNRK